MPANVEYMFSVQQVPWHKIGAVINECVNSDEAIKVAHLDWQVEKCPIFMQRGDGSYEEIPRQFVTRRTDRDGISSILGHVGGTYTPLQNSEAFAFADSLIGSKQAVYETAGSLDGGRIVWMLMKIPGDIIIPGTPDVVEKYIFVSSGHDGKWMLYAGVTPVRIVCQNTLQIGMSQAYRMLTIKHTSKMQDQMAQARQLLGIADKYYETFEELSAHLASVKMTDEQVKTFLENMYPILDGMTERVKDKNFEKQNVVRDIYRSHYTCNLPGIEGTAWSLLNAAIFFSDWERPHGDKGKVRLSEEARAEKMMERNFIGSGLEAKQNAYNLIMSIV